MQFSTEKSDLFKFRLSNHFHSDYTVLDVSEGSTVFVSPSTMRIALTFFMTWAAMANHTLITTKWNGESILAEVWFS